MLKKTIEAGFDRQNNCATWFDFNNDGFLSQNLSNYHIAGIPLKEGFVEVVEEGDDLSGASNEHVGKIKVYAWKGHDFINNANTDVAGVGWILAENW